MARATISLTAPCVVICSDGLVEEGAFLEPEILVTRGVVVRHDAILHFQVRVERRSRPSVRRAEMTKPTDFTLSNGGTETQQLTNLAESRKKRSTSSRRVKSA